MSQISVISKLTGVETTTEGTQVTLSHSSIVKLHVERADISQYARNGNDLIVTLNSGEVITLKNFYVGDAQGASQLVLEESNGALWWIEDPAAVEQYESIASTDALLASSGSDAGGAAIWPWALGGLAVAGGIAVAASGGGGGGGDDDDDATPGNPGNPGNPGDPDTTAPGAPSNLQFSSNGSTVTGTAEPGSTITLTDANGNLVGTGKTGSDGKFTIELGTPLTNGEPITATATDPAGNVSQGVTVTAPDLTAPDAPDIVIVNDDVGAETGPLSNGQRTDDARPTLSGIGEAGTTITVYDNGTKIGTTTVDAKGNWSFTPSTALSNGNHTLTTTATDAAGNTSAPSAAVNFVVDTIALVAPAITGVTDDVSPVTGAVSNGGSTNDQRPQLTGTAEAGSTVTLYDNGIAIGTVTTAANGSWSFTPATNLGEGNHQLTVRATDAAGNTSAASPVFTVVIDITAPATPSAFIVNDETGSIRGVVSAGQTTDASQPRLTGRGDPGSTIIIYDKGVEVGRVTVAANGTWSVSPDSPLTDGAHSITVREIDAAGNQSGISQPINFIVDTLAPAQPVITLNPAGTQVTGTAEPNSTITITNGSGATVGTGTADGNGNFTIDLTQPQTNGQTVSVVATDAAGNASTPATATAPDITAPNPPTNLTVSADGTSVSGNAEPNSTVTVKAPNGDVIGEAKADANGAFTVPIAPPQTNAEVLQVVATDAASNTGQPGLADAPDTTDPLAPGNLNVSEDGTTVTGTAEPGSTVSIKGPDGVEIGSGLVDDQGNFTIPVSPAQLNGETLTADATDKAQNTGPTASVDAPDATPAQTPVITAVEDNVQNTVGPIANNGITNDGTPTLTGTGEAGTRVFIFDGSAQIGTLIVPDSGIWTFTPSAGLPAGGHVFTATAIDEAGNPSGTSNSWSVTIDLTAPAAPVIGQVVDDVQGTTGVLAPNAITNDNRPTLNGSGEPGATISILLDGNQIGTTVVSPEGAWTFTPTLVIPDGSHTLTATATDNAGNVGQPSGGFAFTVDTSIPALPTIGSVTDNAGDVTGPVTSGSPTDETLPLLQGTVPEGTTITVYDGATLLGTATLDGNGGWSFTPTTPLTNGTHVLTVVATNEAGTSSTSLPFNLVVDTLAPATPDAPDVTVNPDNDPTGTPLNPGEPTRDTTPVLSGTGTPGDTVAIYIDGVKQPDEVTVDGNGEWTWTPVPPLTNGSYDISLTVTNKDGAGNESAPSQPVTVVIDTVPPIRQLRQSSPITSPKSPVRWPKAAPLTMDALS